MIKIASWNVNSINIRKEAVLGWLQQHQPDALLLQEIKTVTEKFDRDAFMAIGYHSAVHGQPGYNGVAILSKTPVTIHGTALPDFADDPLSRVLDVQMGDIRLINIYAPNGNPVDSEKFTYKLRWLNDLYAHLGQLLQQRQKFIVTGDFNIIPENIDARHPEQWKHDALFQPESRRMWRSFLNLGLTDALRALHPQQEHLYTFWDYTAGAWQRDNGIRIDHALLSPMLADRLHNCWVDRAPRDAERPSDHTPLVIELKP